MNRATRWPMSTAVVASGLLATRRRRITVGSWGVTLLIAGAAVLAASERADAASCTISWVGSAVTEPDSWHTHRPLGPRPVGELAQPGGAQD